MCTLLPLFTPLHLNPTTPTFLFILTVRQSLFEPRPPQFKSTGTSDGAQADTGIASQGWHCKLQLIHPITVRSEETSTGQEANSEHDCLPNDVRLACIIQTEQVTGRLGRSTQRHYNRWS